jgi:hypothetical protein
MIISANGGVDLDEANHNPFGFRQGRQDTERDHRRRAREAK